MRFNASWGAWVCLLVLAFAREGFSAQVLIRITNDVRENIVSDMGVNFDSNFVIENFYVETNQGAYLLFYPNELDGAGVVLERSDNRDVLVLKRGTDSDAFDPVRGGKLTVVYLYNGIWNTYRTLDLRAVQTGVQWTLFTDDRLQNPINRIHIHKRTALGRVIGIELTWWWQEAME